MNFELTTLGQLAWTQFWQLAVVVLAVTVATQLRPVRHRPHLGYALWLMVLVKCLTPPLFASPTSAFSWTLAEPSVEVRPDVLEAAAGSAPEPSATRSINEPRLTATVPPSTNVEQVVAPPSYARPLDVGQTTPGGKDAVSWSTVGMVLVTVWVLGATAYAGVSLFRLQRMSRRLAHDGQRESGSMARVVSELAGALGLRKPPRLIISAQPLGPALIGLVRPALVVPEAICNQLSPEQRRLVLAHELVHLRRRDHLIGLIQFVAQAIWWFNPLVWWANRETNRVREQCSDEEVLAGLRCEPAHYAQMLLDILRLSPRLRPVLFAAGVRALQVTEQRLEHIMSDASRFHRATPRAYWLAAGLVALLIVPGAGLALEQDAPRSSPIPSDSKSEAAKENTARPDGAEERNEQLEKTFYKHPITVVGKALDHEGSPIEGATIYLVSTGVSREHLLGETTTDADGRYEFRDKQLPIWAPTDNDWKEQGAFQVFGKAPGSAFAWQGMKSLLADPTFRRMNRVVQPGPKTDYFPDEKIELDLTFAPPRTISGRIVDEAGKPIGGVNVHLQNCDYLQTSGKETHPNYREFWAMYQAIDVMPQLLRATSDANGRFVFGFVPPDVMCRVYVEHPKYAHLSLYASTADRPPEQYDDGHPVNKLPLELTLREVRTIPVRVVSAVSDQPVRDIRVSGYQQRATGTSDHGTSNKEGNVTLRLPPGRYKLLADPPRDDGGYIRTYQELVVAEAPAEQPVTLKMEQGCVLILKAIDGDTGKGVAGVTFWYEMDEPKGARTGVQSSTSYVDHPTTNEKGELRVVVFPGKRHYGVGWGRLPDGYRAAQSDGRGRELDLQAGKTVVAEFKLRKAVGRPAQKDSKRKGDQNTQRNSTEKTGERTAIKSKLHGDEALPMTFTGTVTVP